MRYSVENEIEKNMQNIDIHLVHDCTEDTVEIDTMLPSHSLMDEVEELFEIPLEIVEIEKRTQEINKKFIEILEQVQEFENGNGSKIHVDQEIKNLKKQSTFCSEAWMTVLTDLDTT